MSKIVAIFGGSRGIGAAISKELYQRNYQLCILSREENTREEFVSLMSLPSLKKPISLTCDVRDEGSVQEAFSTIHDKVGAVDTLINAAGINKDGLLMKTSHADLMDILNTNLVGSILTCKHALRHMIPQKKGCIINIGSIVGSRGNAGQCAYSSSKAGIEGLTKSLAKEVGSRGIRVNCIAPGYIKTDMTAAMPLREVERIISRIPLQRLGEPHDVALMSAFLMDASYITGQVLYVDGGLNTAL